MVELYIFKKLCLKKMITLGYFCHKFSDPLPATFKVGSCPTVFISAQLFPFYLNIQQSQLVYLSFGLPRVRRIVFLAGITVLLEENLKL